MWHKPCRTFHPWCPCIKNRCLLFVWITLSKSSSVVTSLASGRRQTATQSYSWLAGYGTICELGFVKWDVASSRVWLAFLNIDRGASFSVGFWWTGMHYVPPWPIWIYTLFQRLLTVHLHHPNGKQNTRHQDCARRLWNSLAASLPVWLPDAVDEVPFHFPQFLTHWGLGKHGGTFVMMLP